MPSLFFPNPDAVRIAVSAGVVPADTAARPVVAGTDATGGAWVQPPAGLTLSPQLTRLGVRLLTPPPDLAFAERPCWAALVPLVPTRTSHPAGSLLFDLPADRLTRFVATAQRLHPQPVRFLFVGDRAVLRVEHPPHFLTLAAADLDGRAYRPAARGAWVRIGYEHPLPGPVGFDPHRTALVDPPAAWRVLPDVPFAGTGGAVALPAAAFPASGPQPRATIRVPLKVRKTRTAPDALESLWLLSGGRSALADFVAESDERLVHALHAAEVTSPDGRTRIVLRPADSRKRMPVVPLSALPFVPLPGRPDVFLPVGFALSPHPRPDALARTVELPAAHVALLEPDPVGLAVMRLPLSAFRPLKSFVAYSAPKAAPLVVKEPAVSFPLPGFVVPPLAPKPESELTITPPPSVRSPAATARRGVLSRLTGLFRSNKSKDATEPPKPADPLDPPATPVPLSARARNEWAARRKDLERQVVASGGKLDPRSRGDLWAELASLYAETGQPADAAICWTNAVWDRAAPPAEWFDAWTRAEAKAARLGAEKLTVETVLARPSTVAVARVTAALMVRAGRQLPGANFPWADAVRMLDRFEPDLPARAVWLARLAASAAAGDDPLSLARCRDRLFARLSSGGTALDLDAPGFLRFHGTAGGERFADAREWLPKARAAARKWLERTDPGADLAEFGMDADFAATAAYADLLFAWGLMKLGDRSHARALEADAANALLAVARPDVNPEVHRRLVARFRSAIRAADHGRTATDGPDPSLVDPLAEYAVARLALHSRVLNPAGGTNGYLGHDLTGLVGGDGFGTRLVHLLLSPGDPNAALRDLLAEAVASREGSRLPRAVLAGFDMAARLNAATAAELLARTPAALRWMPNLALLEAEGKRWEFESRLHARLLRGAVATAVRFHLPEPIRGVATHLATVLGGMDTAVREGVARSAVPVFRGLRRLGLVAECEAILRRVGERANETAADRLSFAVGWSAVGREAMAVRALDEARDRLFVTGIADVRERTAMAIRYATALGHVLPRLALGRLEELFQRLDVVTVDGATARYYALKPLELIDAAVTSVVTDEFALGPQVRGWLDDDEFQLRKRITKQLAEVVG